jgi:hypothetical protein
MNYGYSRDSQSKSGPAAKRAAWPRGGRVLITSLDFLNPTAKTGGGVFVFAKTGRLRHN